MQEKRFRKNTKQFDEYTKNGFFIECGAYDGETRSNTLYLEQFSGWSGLLIEADPINFTKMLQKNRRAYLSPTCLSIIKSPIVASFLMARNVGRLHDPENTTENVPANTLDVAYTGEHIHVQCLPLILYIAALGVKTIDYFSLDVEGNEIDVLETIPFNEVDIKACILIVS
ncbi:protein star [Lasius niger]|uniref:Protein star n=1 Tax=Lasius niger TaxID=67767 RepID=A0A0J7KC01_LASNI|nr:protein star [Lasius niger]